MITALQNYELLIFNYTPTLRIVGTYHALHNQDKENLENLIREFPYRIPLQKEDISRKKKHCTLTSLI